MAVPLEQFVKHIEDSGILAGETLAEFVPPKASPKDAEELARELVRQKKLTKFQAEQLWHGKGKSLVLGNYVLIEKIGAGGMGQVFKAQHRVMERLVAVKVLPAAMTRNKDAIARFHREVKAAAKLRHLNIIAADDADQASGVHFLVMELVDGSDLSAFVKKNGPFPVAQAVNYIIQAARGLEYAHAEGVVHRDIKPANLLLDKKGNVKILDMGLARIHGDAGQAELTASGAIMGTVDYMAPEQAMSTRTADARADIYSLGCSLHYLLTGKATYDGETLMAKLVAHRDQPIPDLHAACPNLPEGLEEIFRKMVAKSVEDRYQTMAEVIADLERCGSGQPVNSPSFTASDTGLTNFLKDIAVTPEVPVYTQKVAAKPMAGPLAGKDRNRLLPIGGGILGAVLLLAAIGVSLKTRDGTLVVTVDQPDAIVQVLDVEGKIEISQKGSNGKVTISVDPGKHRLRIEKDGFVAFGKEFEIESGGKQAITATLTAVKPVAGQSLEPWNTPEFQKWMKYVAALPEEQQVEAVSKKLVELNPGCKGVSKSRITNGEVTLAVIHDDSTTDLSPLRSLRFLSDVELRGYTHNNRLADLSPLRGMPLNSLYVGWSQVSDLSPLQDCRNLTSLNLTSINVTAAGVAALQNALPNCKISWDDPAKATNPSAPVVPTPPIADGPDPLFIDNNLTSWVGKPGVWKLENGELVGTLSGNTSTFLAGKTACKDFELSCQVRIVGMGVNAGVQFRSQVLDAAQFSMTGPQCEIGGTGKTGWGGLWWEKGSRNGVMSAVPQVTYAKLLKPDDFNEMTLRCVGNKVTITLNGTTTVDGDFSMPDTGLLGWQLVSRGEPVEMRVRAVRFREIQAK